MTIALMLVLLLVRMLSGVVSVLHFSPACICICVDDSVEVSSFALALTRGREKNVSIGKRRRGEAVTPDEMRRDGMQKEEEEEEGDNGRRRSRRSTLLPTSLDDPIPKTMGSALNCRERRLILT